MNTIVPSILAPTQESYVHALAALENLPAPLHVDLTDGRFVPSTSVSLADVQRHEPHHPYDLHVMYDRPEQVLNELSAVKAQRIIIHVESTNNLRAVVDAIRAQGKKVGVALNIETPVSVIASILDRIDIVLFMAVVPGFQGGTFLPAVRDKIQEFKNQYPHVRVAIDGGMDETTIPLIRPLQCDNIVVGSAIVEAENPAFVFHELQDLAGTAEKIPHATHHYASS